MSILLNCLLSAPILRYCELSGRNQWESNGNPNKGCVMQCNSDIKQLLWIQSLFREIKYFNFLPLITKQRAMLRSETQHAMQASPPIMQENMTLWDFLKLKKVI